MFDFDARNTFCISLDENDPRWKRMTERFIFFNMECSRWNASTPTSLTLNFLNYLNGGQRACAESHVRIWKHMLHHNIDYALILEDDACFHKDWKTQLIKINNIINNDPLWDCIFLNVSEPITPMNKWSLVSEQYLTGGYIINLRGIKYIMDLFKNGIGASDWMTTRLQLRGHCYSFFPWLIIQEGNESTIGSNCDADHKKVLRCLNEIHCDIKNYI
jgi:GR25 family glycosyltransferase involved in LPS biosynthesis